MELLPQSERAWTRRAEPGGRPSLSCAPSYPPERARRGAGREHRWVGRGPPMSWVRGPMASPGFPDSSRTQTAGWTRRHPSSPGSRSPGGKAMPLAALGLDPKSKQSGSTGAELIAATWGQDHGNPQAGPLLHPTHPSQKGHTADLYVRLREGRLARGPPPTSLLLLSSALHLLPAASQVLSSEIRLRKHSEDRMAIPNTRLRQEESAANSPGLGSWGWGWGSCSRSLSPKWAKFRVSPGLTAPGALPHPICSLDPCTPRSRLRPGPVPTPELAPHPAPAAPACAPRLGPRTPPAWSCPWACPRSAPASAPRPHQPCGEHLGPRTQQRAHPSPRSVCACSPARALGSRDTLLPPRASPRPQLSCYPSPDLGVFRPAGRAYLLGAARVPASLAPLRRTARRPRGAARIPG